MRYLGLFLCLLCTLVFSACSDIPENQEAGILNGTQKTTEGKMCAGGMIVQNELPLPEHKENIPLCRALKLKPLNDQDIIKIDDVIQNCSYQDAETYYSSIGGGGAAAFPFGTLYENGFTIDRTDGSGSFQPVCKTEDGITIYDFPEEIAPGFKAFLHKHHIKEKAYISDILYRTADFEATKGDFRCMQDSICGQLVTLPRGEAHGHFFFYGILSNITSTGVILDGHSYDSIYTDIFVLDDRLYDRNYSAHLEEDSQGSPLDALLQTDWKIHKVLKDKMIVKRGINGELLNPFKNQEHINREELDERSLNERIPLGKFQLQTCEVYF